MKKIQICLHDNKIADLKSFRAMYNEYCALEEIDPDLKGHSLYLESPIMLKHRVAIQSAFRFTDYPLSKRESLLVPRSFKKLDMALSYQLSGEPAFPECIDHIEETIGGKVYEEDFTNHLRFAEFGNAEKAGRTHPLKNIPTGIAQLGILAHLIKIKVLDKGCRLFLEDPDAGLNKNMLFCLAKVLYKMALKRLEVFIITASDDLDALFRNKELFNDHERYVGTLDPERALIHLKKIKEEMQDEC